MSGIICSIYYLYLIDWHKCRVLHKCITQTIST